MGNKTIINQNVPIFKEQQWQLLECDTVRSQYGQFNTLRNRSSGQLIDEYKVECLDQQEYINYVNSFVWRLKQPHIVRGLFLKEQHQQQMCSKKYAVKVYIQHIRTRLSDITDIPYPQNLYVCLCALDGYSKLYSKIDYFRVQQTQICVDLQGQVRVWINSDLSKNYPDIVEETSSIDQSSIVQQIIELITQNTDTNSQPTSLREYFIHHSQRLVGFEEAKMMIKQYARSQNVEIPTCFQSILQIYEKQQQYSKQNIQSKPNDSQKVKKSICNQTNKKSKSNVNQNIINLPILNKYQTGPIYANQPQNNFSLAVPNNDHRQSYHERSSLQTFREGNHNNHHHNAYQQLTNPIHINQRPIMMRYQRPTSNKLKQFPIGIQPHWLPPRRISQFVSPQISHYPQGYFIRQSQTNKTPRFISYNLHPPNREIPLIKVPQKQKLTTHQQQLPNNGNRPSSMILPNILDLNKAKVQYSFQEDSPLLKQKRSIVQVVAQAGKNQNKIQRIFQELPSYKDNLKEKSNKKFQIKVYDSESNNQIKSNTRNSKTVYFTVQTQEQLDPQIAQDLKRMHQNQLITHN